VTTEQAPDLNALNEKFGRDPEALAWARGHVQRRVDKYRGFSTEARDRGNEGLAEQWRKFANLLQMEFIGGKGCTITPFDERKPRLPAPFSRSCGHCGRADATASACGVPLCHPNDPALPDCYRRVTVYSEPVGAFLGDGPKPAGVEGIIR